MAFYVVDRFEGKVAVIVADDGRTFDVPRRELPNGCHERTVLRIDGVTSGSPSWADAIIDESERVSRLDRARDALKRLSASDTGGDVDL